jgi:hypothetical protein
MLRVLQGKGRTRSETSHFAGKAWYQAPFLRRMAAGRILHGKEGVRVAWRVADLLGGAEQSRKPGDLGARGGQRGVERSDKQLNVFGREYKRRAYLEDVAARARAVDEDARVAHPVHDIFRKLGAL